MGAAGKVCTVITPVSQRVTFFCGGLLTSDHHNAEKNMKRSYVGPSALENLGAYLSQGYAPLHPGLD